MKDKYHHNNDQQDDVRMVPFTKEELQNVQLTLLSKMVQLSHDIHEGKVPYAAADTELRALGETSEKVSRYCKNRYSTTLK